MSAFYDDSELEKMGMVFRETKGEALTIEEMDSNLSTLLDASYMNSKGHDPIKVPAFRDALKPIIADGELDSGGITYTVPLLNGYGVIALAEVKDAFTCSATGVRLDVLSSKLGVSIGGGSTDFVDCPVGAYTYKVYAYILVEGSGDTASLTFSAL